MGRSLFDHAGVSSALRYDDPHALASIAANAKRPLLVGLDIDGVLAPIVTHADEARLLNGVVESLTDLAAARQVIVAAVSGRTLDSMRTFGLPTSTCLVGSHGLEEGRSMAALEPAEQSRLDRLGQLADNALHTAGEGSWIEPKPASLVLHVRQASPAAGQTAIDQLAHAAAKIDGADIKHGSMVLEVFARSADKGRAILRLAAQFGAATSVFVGDDITDEDAFAVLGPDDLAIKVGDAETIASHRLADPAAVLSWLRELAQQLNR